MDKFSLELLRRLSIVLTAVSLYNGFAPMSIVNDLLSFFSTHHVDSKETIYNKVLQATTSGLFCLFLIVLLVKNFYLAAALFTLPGFMACFLGIVVAFSTVIKIALSKDNSQYTSNENNSLILIGLILGTAGIPCFSEWFLGDLDEYVLGSAADFVECVVLIGAYSIYLFLIVALSIKILRDIANLIKKTLNRMSNIGQPIMTWLKDVSLDVNRKGVISRNIWAIIPATTSWWRFMRYILFPLLFLLDMLSTTIQYLILLFIWLPLFCVGILIELVGHKIRNMIQVIFSISDHRVAAISFRISVVSALLLVVITNRVTGIVHSEDATAILEYFSSVVIMPILFEWLYEILSPNVSAQHNDQNK